MKVILNTAMGFDKIVLFNETIEQDYYSHEGHYRPVTLSPEALAIYGRLMADMPNARAPHAGYLTFYSGMLYISSTGNMSWQRSIKNHSETEIGYIGRRHGQNIARVVREECVKALQSFEVVAYESSEPEWFWFETRDDACLRLSGKTVRDWTRLSSSFRARQLSCTDAPAAMRSWLVSLPDYIPDPDAA